MTRLNIARPAPELRSAAVRLAPVGPALWRVVNGSGVVIGHLEAIDDAQGVRYRARRFHAVARVFLDLGDFWSPDDAIEALRYAR